MQVDNTVWIQVILFLGVLAKFIQDWLREGRDRQWKRDDEERQRQLTKTVEDAVAERTRGLFDRLLIESEERKAALGGWQQCRIRLEQITRVVAGFMDRLPGLFNEHERAVLGELDRVEGKVDEIHSAVVPGADSADDVVTESVSRDVLVR